VVTGASSGIGRAVALALAAEGARLHLVGRDAGRLSAVASLAGDAPAVTTHRADLAREADLTALGARLLAEVDNVDILVHAAGVYGRGPVAEAPLADLDAQYRVNLRAPFALTQALVPLLRGGGHVVFVNSTAGVRAAAGVGSYAATKHGLRALADALREELGPLGVRVLSVFVGRTATPMQRAIHGLEGRPWDPARLLQPEDVAACVLHAVGMPRTAEVTELTVRPFRRL
jgi:NADP-dependent 3-hydroxy acid dehydrogenase YdfG